MASSFYRDSGLLVLQELMRIVREIYCQSLLRTNKTKLNDQIPPFQFVFNENDHIPFYPFCVTVKNGIWVSIPCGSENYSASHSEDDHDDMFLYEE